jgi:hypothetical protein
VIGVRDLLMEVGIAIHILIASPNMRETSRNKRTSEPLLVSTDPQRDADSHRPEPSLVFCFSGSKVERQALVVPGSSQL